MKMRYDHHRDHRAIVVVEDGQWEPKVPQDRDEADSDPPCQPPIEPVLQSKATGQWASCNKTRGRRKLVSY